MGAALMTTPPLRARWGPTCWSGRATIRGRLGQHFVRAAPAPVPSSTPGRFIRASLPRLSRSCSGAIASAATDSHARPSRAGGNSARRPAGAPQTTPQMLPFRVRQRLVPPARVSHCRACPCRPRCWERSCAGRNGFSACAVEGELENPHPGQAELARAAPHVRRDIPRSSAMNGSPPRLVEGFEETRRRGPAPSARSGRRRLGRHVPGGLKPAEMIEADEVDLGEQGAHAFHPPAIAARAQRVPVVERDCPSAARLRMK